MAFSLSTAQYVRKKFTFVGLKNMCVLDPVCASHSLLGSELVHFRDSTQALPYFLVLSMTTLRTVQDSCFVIPKYVTLQNMLGRFVASFALSYFSFLPFGYAGLSALINFESPNCETILRFLKIG